MRLQSHLKSLQRGACVIRVTCPHDVYSSGRVHISYFVSAAPYIRASVRSSYIMLYYSVLYHGCAYHSVSWYDIFQPVRTSPSSGSMYHCIHHCLLQHYKYIYIYIYTNISLYYSQCGPAHLQVLLHHLRLGLVGDLLDEPYGHRIISCYVISYHSIS